MKNSLSGWYVACIMAPTLTMKEYLATYQGWRPCIEWCEDHFGRAYERNEYEPARWRFVSEGVFEFQEEKDRTLFLLRWAS